MNPLPPELFHQKNSFDCNYNNLNNYLPDSDEYEQINDDSFDLLVNNFINFAQRDPINEGQIIEIIAYMTYFIDKHFPEKNPSIAQNIINSGLLDELKRIIETKNLQPGFYQTVFNFIAKLIKTHKELIPELFKNQIIYILSDLWNSNDEFQFDLFNIFIKCLEYFPDTKNFFDERNFLINILNYLNKSSNINEIIYIIKFGSFYFKNESEQNYTNKISNDQINDNNISLNQFNNVSFMFIRSIIKIFNDFGFNDQEDIEKYKIQKYCLLSFNYYSNSRQKTKFLINFRLLNCFLVEKDPKINKSQPIHSIFRVLQPIALEIIYKILACSDFEERERILPLIRFCDFVPFIQDKSPKLILFVVKIFIELINIDQYYAVLMMRTGIIQCIYETIDILPFKELEITLNLTCLVILNNSPESAMNYLINENITEKLVEISGIEIQEETKENIKKTLLLIYKISDNRPELQTIIDPVFEDDGILFGYDKPFLL